MRFGLGIATCREGGPYPLGFATAAFLKESTRFAEDEGYYSVWADDHLASTPSQLVDLGQPPNYFESFTTYAYLAAVTSRIKLMTATMVPALREPVLFAKQVATIDRMSEGRLILGMGLGGQRDEFEALAADPKANRGRMLDEFVVALRQLLDTGRGPFQGRYYRFGDIVVAPAPVQHPFPIYLTGRVADAIERAATVADGWIVSQVTPEGVADRLAILRAAAERAGRNPDAIEVCLFIHIAIGSTEDGAREAWDALERHGRANRTEQPPSAAAAVPTAEGRLHLLGTPAQVTARLREYREAGAQHVGLVFHDETHEGFLAQARMFAREVIPHLA